jgi:enamine deaminase RidA (YjgF/YER057c/UK114 family)
MSPTSRLRELGLELPPVASPAGSYVPATQSGRLVFTAGQLPFSGGELHRTGKVGDAVSLEEAQECARLCVFNGQPAVLNGASELLGEVFGDAGLHARSAVGVSELPLDSPVEVELIVSLDPPD